MAEPTLRVCLIMHSTRSDNLGVGALTVSEIEILRAIGRKLQRNIMITVVDWTGKRQPYVEGADIRILDFNTRFLINPFGYFKTILTSDFVIDIGAGDSFADIYGRPRLRRMFIMKFLVHLARKPLVVAPQTIGPFTKKWSTWLARQTLKRSALVATRDAKSTDALRALGYDGPMIEASDVALRLPYDPPPAQRAEGPVRVGINVSGLLMNGGYTGKNELGISLDYPALMKKLVAFFQSEGCEVHLVAHVLPENRDRTHVEDDYRAGENLAKEFPGIVIAPAFVTPSEAKSYIATLDFFMGARMHACIAAFSAGVPVVPMAYSRKFAGLFGSIGYAHTVDCTTQDGEVVLEQVVAAYRNRENLKHEAKAALNQGLEKLSAYEDALALLISKK